VALNGLYVPVNAPWYPAFRAELLSFPAGRNDDQVDALSLCGQLLDVMIHGHVKKAEKLGVRSFERHLSAAERLWG
jgi:phage terminase large subunit-like protein